MFPSIAKVFIAGNIVTINFVRKSYSSIDVENEAHFIKERNFLKLKVISVFMDNPKSNMTIGCGRREYIRSTVHKNCPEVAK